MRDNDRPYREEIEEGKKERGARIQCLIVVIGMGKHQYVAHRGYDGDDGGLRGDAHVELLLLLPPSFVFWMNDQNPHENVSESIHDQVGHGCVHGGRLQHQSHSPSTQDTRQEAWHACGRGRG